jgi:hypothetical protein
LSRRKATKSLSREEALREEFQSVEQGISNAEVVRPGRF